MAKRDDAKLVAGLVPDVFCVRCQGSGVNARLGNQNCISCRGKGFLNAEDQLREAAFIAGQQAKSMAQRLENLKRFKPALYEAVMKTQAEQEAKKAAAAQK